MGMPKSVTKINKNGVTYTSSVDAVNYTIAELTRAALRDTAKVIRRKVIDELKTLPGMKRSRRLYKSTQYWLRRREGDLQIGFKHGAWYGEHQELGTKNMPKKGFLRDTVYNNIKLIRETQAQYLSAIADKNKAERLIDESEGKSGDGEE
jgi:HK97 gp10 family phage protein